MAGAGLAAPAVDTIELHHSQTAVPRVQHRCATVIGALAAGGIGLLRVATMRTSKDWENVAQIVAPTILVVFAMKGASRWLRCRPIEG